MRRGGGGGGGGGGGSGGGGRGGERDALGRIEATHRRIEERLAELAAAAESGDWDVAEAVVGFLARGGARHHEDEERSLFPRLRQAGGAEVEPLLAALEADHRAQAGLHGELAELVDRWIPADQPRLRELAARLREAYAAHIAREERELLPAIARWLDAGALAAAAAEMEARRGDRDGGGGGGGRGGGGRGGGGRGRNGGRRR